MTAADSQDYSVADLDDRIEDGHYIPERSDGYPIDWNQRRQHVYQRDDYQCRNCGAVGGPRGNATLHAHHVVPKSQGGTHHTRNLATLCESCHDRAHPDIDLNGSNRATAPDSAYQDVLDTLYAETDMSLDEFEEYATIVAEQQSDSSTTASADVTETDQTDSTSTSTDATVDVVGTAMLLPVFVGVVTSGAGAETALIAILVVLFAEAAAGLVWLKSP